MADDRSGKDIFTNHIVSPGNKKNYDLKNTLASEKIFSKKDIDWYNKCNRYGYIDIYNFDKPVREFLFFTKPDCYIFDENNKLAGGVADNGVIVEVAKKMSNVLKQLQYSVPDPDGKKNPFMYLLTNSVTSKLDLPGISAESQESVKNMIGASIMYRTHSFKSDNGYDFTLSFTDTAHLEVYSLVKCYDEYMKLVRYGEIQYSDSYQSKYIVNRIIPEQFSIYKFIIGYDGELILYYAKLTGCFFADVPRSEFGDPQDIFKYALSFHAQFVEDMNPQILKEFAMISNSMTGINSSTYLPIYNRETGGINNTWARKPVIIKAFRNDPRYGGRVSARGTNFEYFFKWIE